MLCFDLHFIWIQSLLFSLPHMIIQRWLFDWKWINLKIIIGLLKIKHFLKKFYILEHLLQCKPTPKSLIQNVWKWVISKVLYFDPDEFFHFYYQTLITFDVFYSNPTGHGLTVLFGAHIYNYSDGTSRLTFPIPLHWFSTYGYL